MDSLTSSPSSQGAATAAPYFTIYRDRAGEWRWRLHAASNAIVADSGEGYRDYADCRRDLDVVMGTTSDTLVAELEAPEDAPALKFGPRDVVTTGPVQVGAPMSCESCGLQYIIEPSGLCPNNNCPQHYHSYPAYRAATGQIIPELEAAFHPNPDT